MGDENPIRTLGDYSKPSHEGYRNTIKLPIWNNVDPNQHLKDFLKLVDLFDLDGANRERMRLHLFQFSLRDQARNWLKHLPAGSITTWEDLTTRFLDQFFPPGRTAKLCNDILMFQQHHGESLSEEWTCFKDSLQKVPHHGIDLWLQLHDRNAKESWALLEDLAFYDNESWNDPMDFTKPVKAIALPQDVPSTYDCHLIELENQVQRLTEAHLAPTQLTQVNKVTTSCEIRSGPHDTQYCIKNPEQAFVEYASSHTDEAGVCPKQTNKLRNDKSEGEDREEEINSENINTTPSSPHDPSISFIMKKVRKLNSFFESLDLVPKSSDTEFVCTKGDDGDVMFIERVRKDDDPHDEGHEDEGSTTIKGLGVEYVDTFPTRSELAYHKYLMRGPIPSIFLRNPIITEGCPSNLKIPCNIGHVHVEKAYIDLNSPLNIMTRMMYNWIMKRKLDPRRESE
ncbi:MAK10-like protein [Tanacetum coccineum]